MVYGILAHTVFALTLTLSQTAIASTDNSSETANISEAQKLYAEALPMEMGSEKRALLLNQSESILKAVIKKNPQSLEAHRKLMGIYLMKQDYSNGIRTMQNAINLSPRDPKLFVALAFLYEHSGALEYAMSMLDQALELDPNLKLAVDYKVSIQKKMAKLDMEDVHEGKNVMGANHGKLNLTEDARPATDSNK